MERRFERDAELRQKYVTFMREYKSLGHMTRIDETDARGRRCYLPHHGVLKGDGPSAKLRIVFNGSAPLPGSDTLNRYLYVGPNLMPALADVLLGWRRYQFAYTADIEKMYRQIMVDDADRDLQCILWRETAKAFMAEYRLNTVTYKLACAPYLAAQALRQLAADEAARFPRGAGRTKLMWMTSCLAGSPWRRRARP
ncbi:uncharacterized protein [Cardiocondyla obscurior]|uniref:uncharacterized protein n=1 Tax=Cardiocondyla obscurior TaxID=286306 RepID=UPI0039657AD3